MGPFLRTVLTTIAENIDHFGLKREDLIRIPTDTISNLLRNDFLLDATEELPPEISTSPLDGVQNWEKATVAHIFIFLNLNIFLRL